ncbi:MAG TPA: hypothetical protein VGH73_21660 [Thermoanaerobaculia bacterium]|jgi:hypothetical protein
MKRWTMVCLLTAAALLPAGRAQAQSSNDRDDDGGRHRDRFALGAGIGLVEPLNKVENYYTASLRIRVSGRGDDDARRTTGDEGIIGYVEPEVGYWSPSSGHPGKGNDLLLGINLVGVIPLGPVDTFLGVGAGAHIIDATLLTSNPGPGVSGSQTKLGANAQFGLDIYITRKLSAFGVGRFDLVQGSEDRVQSKVYLGLRARF